MHTQNDIEILIQGASHLSADRKEMLGALLPNLYILVQDSLLLKPQVGDDLLVLLPYLDDDQINQSVSLLQSEDAFVSDAVQEMIVRGVEQKDLDQVLTSGEKHIRKAEEMLSTLDDAENMQDIEKHFTDDNA